MNQDSQIEDKKFTRRKFSSQKLGKSSSMKNVHQKKSSNEMGQYIQHIFNLYHESEHPVKRKTTESSVSSSMVSVQRQLNAINEKSYESSNTIEEASCEEDISQCP